MMTPSSPMAPSFFTVGQGEFAGLVPGHDVGRNLARGKVANLAPEMLLLFGQHERIQAFHRLQLNLHVQAPSRGLRMPCSASC